MLKNKNRLIILLNYFIVFIIFIYVNNKYYDINNILTIVLGNEKIVLKQITKQKEDAKRAKEMGLDEVPIEDEDYKEYYNQLEKQRNADLELIGEEEE